MEANCLHAPSDDPPILSLIPGEIVSPTDPLENGERRVTKKSSTMKSNQSGAKKTTKSGTLLSVSRPIKSRVMSMEDVEAHTLQAVFGGHGSHTPDAPHSRAVSIVEPVAEDVRESASLSSSKNEVEVDDVPMVLDSNDQLVPSSPRAPSRNFSRVPQGEGKGEGKRVLQMCRRMSLDDLRTNHDAVIATTQRTETNTRPIVTSESYQSHSSSFCRFAILWLRLVGMLDFANLRPGCALFCISIVQMILLMGVLIFHIGMGVSDPYISATTLCYLVGVLCAAWRLRWSGVHNLLLRADGLEAYAMKSGFLDEWRRTSRRRLKEVMGFLLVMLCCRWLADFADRIWDMQTRERHEISACFSVSAIMFSAIMFLLLHLVAGMEHAIDSFSINFYADMDMEVALGEWNMIQATLRQVSTKLSAPMLLLGSSCGASLLLLVQLTVLHDETQPQLKSGFPFFCFTSWLFPPVLLFLYAMMRAAGVTEKASRVAPLVNSWNFEDEENDDVPSWMNLGRQYIVQYMIQSEAGFYLQGMRLHAFQVTKLSYYFAAFIFALFSRSWA
eukprot:Skav206315  [mRNA]  locus=scaffold3460:62541:64426:+ [translate_table: standard]